MAWQLDARQRRIEMIFRKLREAWETDQNVPILYKETVEKAAANLGGSVRTTREYFGVLAAQGRIRIDPSENRIYVIVPEEESE